MVDVTIVSGYSRIALAQKHPVLGSYGFLAKPINYMWTHLPLNEKHQFLPTPIPTSVILSFPFVTETYFVHGMQLPEDFCVDTHLTFTNTRCVVLDIEISDDIDVYANVSNFPDISRDLDGDALIEKGTNFNDALVQILWLQTENTACRTVRVKAFVPIGERNASLNIYAGKKGLMTYTAENLLLLAIVLPISCIGKPVSNPFKFLLQHPLSFVSCYDLYVVKPQCYILPVGGQCRMLIEQYFNAILASSAEPMKPTKLAVCDPDGKIMRMKCGETDYMFELDILIPIAGSWKGFVHCSVTSKWVSFCE
jgi:transglutaminase/protease-like cytokinesis protein 3